MLPPTDGAPPEFGPMYGHWDQPEGEDRNQLKRACSNVSGIFINSKCYTAGVNHDHDGYDCTPNEQNFEDFKMFGGKSIKVTGKDGTPTSVFLSIVQGFGPRRKTEGYVSILTPKAETTHPPRSKDIPLRQIVVILKELGPNTYTCLQDSPPDSPSVDDEPMDDVSMDDVDEEVRREVPEASLDIPMREPDAEEGGHGDGDFLPEDGDEELEDGKMAEVTKYLRMLRTANLRYLDNVEKEKENLFGIKDFLPGVLIGERGHQVDKAHRDWELERERGPKKRVKR
jgi:hypothetical protein